MSLLAEVPPYFPFLQARSYSHATYYFACNCCTISLLLSRYILIGKQWYQLPEFIPSNSNSSLHSCISISIYSTLNMSSIKQKLCTNSRFALCILYQLLTGFKQPLQMSSSLCTCYPLYHISCVTISDN